MDDDTLRRSLRARPPADPSYVLRLNSVQFGATPRASRHGLRLVQMVVLLLGLSLLGAVAFIIGSQPSPHPDGLGVFEPTSSMAEPRSRHTATLLRDGRVLVTGGLESRSAELYDPVTETWTATGSMTTDRQSHSATLLFDGRVLVAGGQNLETDSSGGMGTVARQPPRLYDPDTGHWTATGDMSEARSGHTATLLADGTVLVIGPLSAEIFDPGTGRWTKTQSMHVSRGRHTATRLLDGTVLVVGGSGFDQSSSAASAETYDSGTGTWTATGDMRLPRAGHAAVLLADGRVLVMGGSGSQGSYYPVASAEVYDPNTRTWSATGDMAAARVYLAATRLADGRVLVTGGSDAHIIGEAAQHPRNNPAELYDPTEASWTGTGVLSQVRVLHTATLLPDGRVLIAGGQPVPVTNSPTSSADLFVLDPDGSR